MISPPSTIDITPRWDSTAPRAPREFNSITYFDDILKAALVPDDAGNEESLLPQNQGTQIIPGSQSSQKRVDKIVSLSKIPREAYTLETSRHHVFLASQKWEGVVTSKSQESFWATLHELTATQPDDEAEFFLSEVSEDDLPLVEEGAKFIFAVGRLYEPGGTVRRCLNLSFRRLPNWSPDAILDAHERAKVIAEKLEPRDDSRNPSEGPSTE